ncbi:MAG TPA: AAA family ATPase [Candidatus Bathyarchaeia archaeon]
MRLVFIYGPPASGKLTIATELAKLTGFKLFHNHVSIQFVQSIFEFGTKAFWRLTNKYRLEMIKEAAKDRIDTIFTFVYSKDEDDQFVKQILQRVRSRGGQVCFVRLYCDRQELVRRVKASQRKRMGKIGSERTLKDLFQRHNLDSEIPFRKSLSVDTTKQSPRNVARSIARRYKLPIATNTP